VIFDIKLFVNILSFIVQQDLNKTQSNLTKFLIFLLTKIRFPVKKRLKFVRETAKFGREIRNLNFFNLKT
jgi:hypothetical protein